VSSLWPSLSPGLPIEVVPCRLLRYALTDFDSRHIKAHTRPFKCDDPSCDSKGFRYKKDLDRHCRQKHPRENDPASRFWCPFEGCKFPVRQEKAFVDETTLKDISRVSIHRLDSSSRADNTFLYCPSPASCLASVHCMSRVTLHTQTPQIVWIVVLTPAILIWRNACRTSHGWTRALTETRQLLPQPRCLTCRLPACYPARAHGKSTQTQFERFRRHCSSRCSHELGLTPTSVSHNRP
jgi:hypothetical protein